MTNRVYDFGKERSGWLKAIVFDSFGFTPSWDAMILLLFIDIVISAIFHYGLIRPVTLKLST